MNERDKVELQEACARHRNLQVQYICAVQTHEQMVEFSEKTLKAAHEKWLDLESYSKYVVGLSGVRADEAKTWHEYWFPLSMT